MFVGKDYVQTQQHGFEKGFEKEFDYISKREHLTRRYTSIQPKHSSIWRFNQKTPMEWLVIWSHVQFFRKIELILK